MIAAAQLGAMLNGEERGGRWWCQCPLHEDKTPSLRVSTSRDGHTLIVCYSCRDTDAILDALGIPFSELFVGGRPPGRRRGVQLHHGLRALLRRRAIVDDIGWRLAFPRLQHLTRHRLNALLDWCQEIDSAQ